ncbi:MAG: DUF3467 domain-containing protein [Planctomycetales bacterium]|nr:DUF3467 domain-containing protein [Planctomycetales bacterium]NIM08042.1 DUF3467 domain-containing protein [Planctomycetales bacterium]NIN07533.1 DUF3467 domain-containing protein [Planctomycetales bacterium]NIN76640.1 DUF3467 domain-containing protein [Planctomycetales bacterium]NIO33828.1 DUF3467 domain-containing protein [Planctomycetales bacterium]
MSTSDSPPEDSGDSQQVRAKHLSARVPEKVGSGVFSTGVILMTGATEFVLDFVQNLSPPARIVARVVLPHAVLPQVIEALRKNLDMYQQKFGPPPELPRNESQKRPTVQELYDELKLPDEMLAGTYANGLMISHGASEFKLDFLTNMYPHPAVSTRVYLAAPQVPRVVESLNATYQQFQQRVQRQRPPQDEDPAADPSGPDA